MQINNGFKRASSNGWCKHTDNNYGGRNHKAVRMGKKILRRQFINFLNKNIPIMDPNEYTCVICGKDFLATDSDLFCSVECFNNQL